MIEYSAFYISTSTVLKIANSVGLLKSSLAFLLYLSNLMKFSHKYGP
jgi:hypothetical protein